MCSEECTAHTHTHTRPHRYLQTAYPTYVPSPYSVPKALYIAKAKYYLLTYLHYSYITACYVNKTDGHIEAVRLSRCNMYSSTRVELVATCPVLFPKF